jgi:hypothetical protein
MIDRFIDSYPTYFNIDLICECTGVEPEAVQERLKQLVVGNTIKKISKYEDIYIANRGRYATKVGTIHSGSWIFEIKTCNDICCLLQDNKVKSIRQLASLTKRSRQWAYLYLEALISVDAVGIRKSGYYTKDVANIFKVGSIIRKGIISELRAQCGIQPKKRSKRTAKNTKGK